MTVLIGSRTLVTGLFVVIAACTSGSATSDTTNPAASTSTTSDPTTTSSTASLVASTHASTGATDPTAEISVPTTPRSATSGIASLCPDGGVGYLAFDRSTGAELWHTCTSDDAFRSLIAATDDVVYSTEHRVTGSPGEPVGPDLVAIDAHDGTERWRVELAPFNSHEPAGPLPSSGVIVAVVPAADGGMAGDVAAIDATSGDITWRIPDAGRMTTLIAASDAAVVLRSWFPSRTSDATTTIAAGPPEPMASMWGVEPATGDPLWNVLAELPPAADQDPVMTAAVVDELVITEPGVAQDSTTGAIVWESDSSMRGSIGGAADGVVVTGGQDDPVTAYDVDTGAELWTRSGSAVYDNVWAIADGAVYVVDREAQLLVAYELRDGRTRWQVPFDADRYSWPFHAADGALYTMWTNIDTVSTADGGAVWSTTYAADDQQRFVAAVANTTTLVTAIGGSSGGD